MFPFNELLLYNWGETFLNCDYIKIIKYLHYNKQMFSVSTNASVLQYASNEMIYKYCKTITFSMSGFSQSSYDKIHGFNFKKIKENVCTILKNARDYGFEGEAVFLIRSYKEWKKLRENMLGCSTCEQCRNLGIAYRQCNNPLYLEEKSKGEIQ